MALTATEHVGPNRVVRDADERQVVVVAGPGGAVGGGGIADTTGVSATATSPTANQVVGNLGVLTPGIYSVELQINLSGTAETALRNATLELNGSAVVVVPTLTGTTTTLRIPRLTITTGSLLSRIVANAVVGAIYTTMITATRIA